MDEDVYPSEGTVLRYLAKRSVAERRDHPVSNELLSNPKSQGRSSAAVLFVVRFAPESVGRAGLGVVG